MTVNDMHITFRTLGQQMGLQNVRGILPESIDVFLNVGQESKVNQIIAKHLATPIEEEASQRDNFISPFNDLRTLFSIIETYGSDAVKRDEDNKVVTISKAELEKNNTSLTIRLITSASIFINSKWVKCRMIERDKLEDVMADYCNKPTDDNPVAYYANDKLIVHVEHPSLVGKLRVNVIYNPSKISLSSSADCILPEHLHLDVVELAVRRFFAAVYITSPNQATDSNKN